jgi:hypothetical protein
MRRLRVLPNTDDRPPSVDKTGVRLSVAFDVPAKLGCPPGPVRLHGPAMARACMPETTVDEHRDSGLGKEQINLSSQLG